MNVFKLNPFAENLSEYEQQIVLLIVKNNNKIRISKPEIEQGNQLTADAAYVWRMLMFCTQSEAPYVCMPVMAEFYITMGIPKEQLEKMKFKTNGFERNRMKEILDPLVDKLLSQLPKEQWEGVSRWASALGY